MFVIYLELLYFFVIVSANELIESFVFICGGHIAYFHRVPEDGAETEGGM